MYLDPKRITLILPCCRWNSLGPGYRHGAQSPYSPVSKLAHFLVPMPCPLPIICYDHVPAFGLVRAKYRHINERRKGIKGINLDNGSRQVSISTSIPSAMECRSASTFSTGYFICGHAMSISPLLLIKRTDQLDSFKRIKELDDVLAPIVSAPCRTTLLPHRASAGSLLHGNARHTT